MSRKVRKNDSGNQTQSAIAYKRNKKNNEHLFILLNDFNLSDG